MVPVLLTLFGVIQCYVIVCMIITVNNSYPGNAWHRELDWGRRVPSIRECAVAIDEADRS